MAYLNFLVVEYKNLMTLFALTTLILLVFYEIERCGCSKLNHYLIWYIYFVLNTFLSTFYISCVWSVYHITSVEKRTFLFPSKYPFEQNEHMSVIVLCKRIWTILIQLIYHFRSNSFDIIKFGKKHGSKIKLSCVLKKEEVWKRSKAHSIFNQRSCVEFVTTFVLIYLC